MTPAEARLLRFVPRRLAQLLDAQPTRRAQGVILHADVVGFSSLADGLLAGKGSAGVDQLGRILNATLLPIVDAVDEFGGEIVSFPGDAVVSVWLAGPDAPLTDLCGLALACAKTTQRRLDALPAIEGISLEIRQGLGAGPITLERVGDDPSFVVATGPVLDELTEVMDELEPGSVAATAATGLQELLAEGGSLTVSLGESFSDSTLEDSGSFAARIQSAQEALGEPAGSDVALSFVEPQLQVRARRGTEAWPTHLRTVTAMFCRVAPSERASTQWLAESTQLVQRLLAQHLGRLTEVSDDGKGVVLVGIFGFPGAPVSRAQAPALAAIGIHDALATIGIDASIGVSTGRVIFGELGGTMRRALGLRGSVMNLAARLMMLGPGTWFDAATSDAARRFVTMGEPTQQRLKGFAKAIPVSRGAAAIRNQRVRELVGRHRVLDAIEGGLGEPGLSLISGAAGVGKSALVDAIVGAQRSTSRIVRRVGANPSIRSTPGGALARLLESKQALDAAGERAALLGPAFGEALEESTATESLQGFVRAAATVDLLVDLLANPGELLVVEDAQWLDGVSIEALARLAEQSSILVTARAGGGDPPEQLRLLGRGHRAHLDGLDAEEVEALVLRERGVAEVPSGLVPWLMSHTQGHPGFVLELLVTLTRERVWIVDGGRTTFFDAQMMRQLKAPETMESAFSGRVDRLSEHGRTALAIASALGTEIAAAPWEAGCQALRCPWEESIEELTAAGLVLGHDATTYRFTIPLLSNVVHDRLVRDRRREIHRALAVWLETDVAGTRHLHASALAWHWGNAGEFSRAIAALDQAYAQALRGGLARAAGRHASTALRLDREAAELGPAALTGFERGRWQYRLAQAARRYGDTDDAYEHLQLAAQELDLRLPDSAKRWNRMLAAELGRHLVAGVVKPRRRSSPEDHLRGSVLALLSLALMFRAQHPLAMVASALRAVTLSRRCETPVPATIAYSMVAVAFTGLPGLAERYLAAGREQARAVGDPLEALDAMIGRLLFDIGRCRWESAQSQLDELLPLLEAGRTEHLRAVLYGLLAVTDILIGKEERAEERIAAMIAVADIEGYLQAKGWARNLQTMIALKAGDLELASERASQAWELLDRRGEPERLVSRAFMATCLSRRGQHAEATEMIDRVETLLDEEAALTVTSFEGVARCVEIWLVAHAAGHEPHLAIGRAGRALDRMRKFAKQFAVARPRLATLEAAMQRARGKASAPRFDRAKAIAEEHGMPYEVDYALIGASSLFKTSAGSLPPGPQRP